MQYQPAAGFRDFTIWTSFKKIRFTRILVLLEFTKSHPTRDRYLLTLGPPGFYFSLKRQVQARPLSYKRMIREGKREERDKKERGYSYSMKQKNNTLRLIIISKHLFLRKAINDRKMVLEGDVVIIRCKRQVLKPSRMLADLEEIRLARILILLPIKLWNHVMEIYDANFPESMKLSEAVTRLAQQNL